MMNKERLARVQHQMKERGIGCFVLTDPSSIAYLCDYVNHPGERCYALVLYVDKDPIFFLNRLFPKPTFNTRVIWHRDEDDMISLLSTLLHGYNPVGIDKSWDAHFLLELQDILKDIQFVNGSYCIDYVRMIKSDEEIEIMKKASFINDQAMAKMKESLSLQFTENEMASRLKGFYEELESGSFSFDPIVAYGPNGADPHHGTDDTQLKEGDSIVIDMGCVYQGYCSDMTRTFFYKTVSEKQRQVYNLVLEANLKAQAMIKPGVKLCDIDQTARDVITEGGYGPYFTHRLGHFIGRDVHEYGGVSAAFNQEVEEGMIFSIEPGIYLPGEFGVRIEDLVLVTKDGCVSLNDYPKDLMIIE